MTTSPYTPNPIDTTGIKLSDELLMEFRIPKREKNKYEYPNYKVSLKNNKNLFIHNDIRPFSILDEVKLLDSEIVKYIPWILKMTETY